MNAGDPEIHTLIVLYDQECALCTRLKERLETIPMWIALEFLALQDPRVPNRFPGIEAYDPAKTLVVLDNRGGVYTEETAWIMILYATQDYRELSYTLSEPGHRFLARIACTWISNNRRSLNHPKLLRHITTRKVQP